MPALSINVPFPVFQDRDGQPLDNGYVYIGTPYLDPQTNPVQVYFDDALTIPAAQPLRTINGYVSNAGTPAQLYVNGVNFSIKVLDSKANLVYSFPDGSGISPNASGIQYDPAGVGAVSTTVQAKLRETVSVKDFGAVGDGVTDDTTSIQAAFNSGIKQILIPPGTYRLTQTLTINGNGYRIVQAGNLNSILLKDFSGPVIQWNAGEVIWENCCINGQGATYSGASEVGIFVTTGGGFSSKLFNPRIYDIGSACVRFNSDSGAGFSIISGLLEPRSTTQAAIDHVSVADTFPAGRIITGVQSGGVLIDFAYMETTLVSSCVTNFIRYDSTTKKASVIGCRIQNGAAGTININGVDNILVGNTIAGNVDVTNAASYATVMSNAFASGAGITNTGNISTAIIDQTNVVYTPIWSSSGTQPVLGNGIINGYYDRNGKDIHAFGVFTAGSTSSFGTGSFRFSLPFTNVGSTHIGTARILDSGSAYYLGVAIVSSGTNYVEITTNSAAGQVDNSIPMTWAAGDTIIWDIIYRCMS